MVATGWVGPEHMAEERVHFSGEREGEFKREEFLKEQLESFKRERGEVCPGYLNSALRGTSQWLS